MRANVGYVYDPAQWSGPHALAAANLTVEREQLRIECARTDSEATVRCQFTARYQIFNPGAQTEHGFAAFCGTRAQGVEVRVDGQPSLRPLTPAERAQLARNLDDVLHGPLRSGADCSASGFDLVLAPSARAEIVAEGVLEPGAVGSGTYALSASDARHAFVRPRVDERPQRFQYLLAPIRTWSSVGPIEIEVRIPASWESKVRLVGAPGEVVPALPMQHLREGPAQVIRLRIDATAADALELDMSPARSIPDVGGPILGVGGAFRANEGFRLRAGWELTGPSWLLYGLAADTNFQGLWVLSPTIEAASRSLLFILPSCGLGLGMPVRLQPDPAVGIRSQLSMMFMPVGLSFGLDVFPSDKRPLQLTLLGQVSL